MDVRHGRCRFQGYWNNSAVRPSGGPIGNAFLFVDGYVTGVKCAVTMNLQVVSYDFRELTVFSYDHYYDASQPTSAGKNERWLFWGPIVGGAYDVKIGNVVYLLSFTLKDLTSPPGTTPVGQVGGPKANWCDGWPPPTSPPGCTA